MTGNPETTIEMTLGDVSFQKNYFERYSVGSDDSRIFDLTMWPGDTSVFEGNFINVGEQELNITPKARIIRYDGALVDLRIGMVWRDNNIRGPVSGWDSTYWDTDIPSNKSVSYEHDNRVKDSTATNLVARNLQKLILSNYQDSVPTTNSRLDLSRFTNRKILDESLIQANEIVLPAGEYRVGLNVRGLQGASTNDVIFRLEGQRYSFQNASLQW